MIIDTTLNINNGILTTIAKAAQSKGVPHKAMIVLLLKKALHEIEFSVRLGRPVQYQERSDSNDWRPTHVQFREDEYEYFLDMRKLYKLSVSLILALAVKNFF